MEYKRPYGGHPGQLIYLGCEMCVSPPPMATLGIAYD